MISADTHVRPQGTLLQKMKNLCLIMPEENKDSQASHQNLIMKNATWRHKNHLLEQG